MNKARIKLLISDLKAAEREILHGASEGDRELLHQLKAAVDDSRLTIWSALVPSSAGPQRQAHVESVRMARVVEMLRQINRDKLRSERHPETPASFGELMRIA